MLTFSHLVFLGEAWNCEAWVCERSQLLNLGLMICHAPLNNAHHRAPQERHHRKARHRKKHLNKTYLAHRNSND